MDTLIWLGAFLGLGLFILVAFEVRERRRGGVSTSERAEESVGEVRADGGECCGQHLVCERDTLLQTNGEVEYFEDEELDALSGIAPEDYTDAQHAMIAEVFETLQESEVSAWVRSLQLRNIALPLDIREEALMIVREQRGERR